MLKWDFAHVQDNVHPAILHMFEDTFWLGAVHIFTSYKQLIMQDST